MKVTINDSYNNYVALEPSDILRELYNHEISYRTMTVFVELLKFLCSHYVEVASWINSGWMGYDGSATRKSVIDCFDTLKEEIEAQWIAE